MWICANNRHGHAENPSRNTSPRPCVLSAIVCHLAHIIDAQQTLSGKFNHINRIISSFVYTAFFFNSNHQPSIKVPLDIVLCWEGGREGGREGCVRLLHYSHGQFCFFHTVLIKLPHGKSRESKTVTDDNNGKSITLCLLSLSFESSCILDTSSSSKVVVLLIFKDRRLPSCHFTWHLGDIFLLPLHCTHRFHTCHPCKVDTVG